MIRIIIKSLLLISLLATPAYAYDTYHVNPQGGTAAQCTGATNNSFASQDPCTTNCNCAVKGLTTLLDNDGGTILSGGDTVYVHNYNSGTQAEYMHGYGADGMSCGQSSARSCVIAVIPDGDGASNPTRILGDTWDSGCTNPPQIWGTQGTSSILRARNNVEIQCLEITDHSSCSEAVPESAGTKCERETYPFGEWASQGLRLLNGADSVLLKNINIHGVGYKGVKATLLGDVTLENFTIRASPHAGWHGDVCDTCDSSYTGTIDWTGGGIKFSGCAEQYPTSATFDSGSTDIHSCCEKDNSVTGYGGCYGDAVGMGSGDPGNWNLTDVEISFSTSDGWDCQHCRQSKGASQPLSQYAQNFKRVRMEGNVGNAVKGYAKVLIENSILLGNCEFFDNNRSLNWASGEFMSCRAGGATIEHVFGSDDGDSDIIIKNSLLYSNGIGLVRTNTAAGCACNANTDKVVQNSLMIGGAQHSSPGDLSNWWYEEALYGCNPACIGEPTTTYSVIWNVDDTAPSGTGNLFAEPLFADGRIPDNYDGIGFDLHAASSSSNFVNAGDNSISLSEMVDIDNSVRPVDQIDIGPYEWGSVVPPICDSDNCSLCTPSECVPAGCYYWGGVCQSTPEPGPECDSTHCDLCSDQAECEAVTPIDSCFFWDDGSGCLDEPQPPDPPACDADNCGLCNETECNLLAGCYYWNSLCQDNPEPPKPDPVGYAPGKFFLRDGTWRGTMDGKDW